MERVGFWICIPILAVSLIQATWAQSQSQSDEHRLILSLTNPDTYDKRVRPGNVSDTVNVKFGLDLFDLIDVDEKDNTITTYSSVKYIWNDPRLTWDPADYGGITRMRIQSNALWSPDIDLYNSTTTGALSGESSLAFVHSTGHVLLILSVRLTSTCYFDMQRFPFDEHECSMSFGSWVYDGNSVDIDFHGEETELDISAYRPSPEWELVSRSGQKNENFYPCCGEPYPYLTFTLKIRRTENFYTHTYIGPALITSLIIPGIFALPVTGLHRYLLGIGLLITLERMTSSFHEVLPATNSTPLVDRWYVALQALVVFALALSIVVTNLANRALYGHGPPGILKKVVLGGLARVLCVKKSAKQLTDESGDGASNDPCQWEMVARVLDRLFFLIYCLIILLLVIPWIGAICAHA